MLLDNPFIADARVEKECESLASNGYKVTVYAVMGTPPEENRPYAHIVRNISLSVVNNPFTKKYQNYLQKTAALIAEKKFSIIHCHDYKMLIIGAYVKKINPTVKLVYDAHEYLYGWPWYKEIPRFSNRIKGWMVWKKYVSLEKRALPITDAIITVSESLSEEMQKQFSLEQTPLVIRNVPEHFEIHGSNTIREKLGLKLSDHIFVHSGNLYHTAKRTAMLIDVFKTLGTENCHLVFIGDSEKIRQLEKNTNISNIHFLPYPSRPELYQLLASADFGIVHTWQPRWQSHWFSLPNRILEYTIAQIPVIATSQPEFLKLGNTYGHIGFYHGNKPDELKKVILGAIENKPQLKQNAIAASGKISWEQESEKLIDLYQSLLNDQ